MSPLPRARVLLLLSRDTPRSQVKVPVGFVWKLLPWNNGPPTCSIEQVYLDEDVRVAKDSSGQYFVYARPV